MRYILCSIAFLFASLCTTTPLPASIKQVKVGDFKIDGFAFSKKLILDDGNVYKPLSNRQEASTWLQGDTLLVLRGKHRRNSFTLVNLRTGQKAKAKIVTL